MLLLFVFLFFLYSALLNPPYLYIYNFIIIIVFFIMTNSLHAIVIFYVVQYLLPSFINNRLFSILSYYLFDNDIINAESNFYIGKYTFSISVSNVT